jgi:hypothetical protein
MRPDVVLLDCGTVTGPERTWPRLLAALLAART